MRRIVVVITARASYARIRSALLAIQRHPDLELQIVVSGSALLSRYGDITGSLETDGLPITARVHTVVEGETPLAMSKTTGLAMMEMATVFDNLKPDVVVTIADRYETLATAAAAAYQNITLAHVQGGEVSGSIDDKVRNAVTQLADVHLVATEKAAERVISMGARNVHVTGCPSIDLVADSYAWDPLHRLSEGVGADLELSKAYLVVVQHPVTTEYDEARNQAEITLRAVAETGIQAAWFWPNVDGGSDGTSGAIRAFREHHSAKIRFIKHLPAREFLRLIRNARAVVGNSSVGIRECSALGVPAVNIGSRQDGRERASNVIDVSHNQNSIVGAIYAAPVFPRMPSTLYGDGNAGEKIAGILARRNGYGIQAGDRFTVAGLRDESGALREFIA